jgi:hypothetical protein
MKPLTDSDEDLRYDPARNEILAKVVKAAFFPK